MGQPHLPGRRLAAKLCRLLERHVLVFPGLCRLLLFPVHALADEQINVLCILGDDRDRPCVRGIRDGKPAPCGPKHHIGRQKPSLMLDGLALLQAVPESLGDVLGLRPLHVEPAFPRYGDPVAVACDIVVHAEGVHHIRAGRKSFPRLRKFLKFQFKGQLRRDHPQGADDPL